MSVNSETSIETYKFSAKHTSTTTVRQLWRQHLYTIFITSNHILFDLGQKKKLVKYLKVPLQKMP